MNYNILPIERYDNHFGSKYDVKKVLFSGQSEFQKVEVVETLSHGKMLFNDDLAMISERDEFIYHEMITHIPLYSHPNPKKVLIIGGGDGGTAREVLKHSTVEKCVIVEIDKMVVDACIKHIPQTASVITENPKLELLIEDGIKYVKDTNETFDVILVDSTDPIGPAQPLFNVSFYKDIFKCLNNDGIVISQGESIFYAADMQKKLMEILSEVFPITTIYNYANLTYPAGNWSFTVGSKKYRPELGPNQDSKIDLNSIKHQYYTSKVHTAAFSLPAFQEKFLKDFIK